MMMERMYSSAIARRNGAAWKTVFVCIALVALTVLTFLPVLRAEFVEFDDDLYVTANRHVQQGLSGESVKWAFTTLHAAFWHPLTWLSLMLDYELFGSGPAGFHATNLLLHVISTLLLFGLLYDATRALWRSAITAALFAVHPLHVESVAWVAERKDVLSTLFWFLCTWTYVRYARRPRPGAYLSCLAIFVLGLMAKPMLVSLPIIMLLLDVWPLDRLPPPPLNLRSLAARGWSLVVEKIPFFLLAAGAAGAAYLAQWLSGAIPSMESSPLPDRAANAVVSAALYIGGMFAPIRLGCFYPLGTGYSTGAILFAAGILATLTVLAAASVRSHRYLAVGWLWYIVSLLPVSGLVQVGSHARADRYTYVPFVGLFIMLVWGTWTLLAKLVARVRVRRATAACLALPAVAALAVAAYVQAGYWQNTVRLFNRTLAVTGDNAMIRGNLGAVLYRQGDLQGAFQQYVEAIRINPRSASAHSNLGVLGVAVGDTEGAEKHYREALAIKPHYADAHENLAGLLYRLERIDEAVYHYGEAARLKPEAARPRANLAGLLFVQGRIDDAIAVSREAIALDPGDPQAYYNLGIFLERAGDLGGAASNYLAAIRLDPGASDAVGNLQAVLNLLPDTAAAGKYRAQLLRIRPDLARTPIEGE